MGAQTPDSKPRGETPTSCITSCCVKFFWVFSLIFLPFVSLFVILLQKTCKSIANVDPCGIGNSEFDLTSCPNKSLPKEKPCESIQFLGKPEVTFCLVVPDVPDYFDFFF